MRWYVFQMPAARKIFLAVSIKPGSQGRLPLKHEKGNTGGDKAHESGRVQPAPCRPAAAQPLGSGSAPGLLLRGPCRRKSIEWKLKPDFIK